MSAKAVFSVDPAKGRGRTSTEMGSQMNYKDDQAAEMRRMLIDLAVLVLGVVVLGGLITLVLVWMQG